jgi:hypothetical protein
MGTFTPRTLLMLLILASLAACASAPYRSVPLDSLDIVARAETQQQDAFRVRASVPGEAEAEQLFGIPVYDRAIQPVWIEVSNLSGQRARIVLSSLDPRYFSPAEVAYIFRKKFSTEGWMDLEAKLLDTALPRQVGPGETVSGFVFTNASDGTKAFNVDAFLTGDAREYERFTFFITVPGFAPDHAAVNFRELYDENEISEVDTDGLRLLMKDLPGFTSSQDGSGRGRPVNLFFVATGWEMLQALLRAGWSETSYERDAEYLAKAEYLFGRPPDAILRKRRDRSTERAELSLWMAPVLVNGEPLWVGQFRHAIGRRFRIGELLLGARPDPETTEGRNYVLQDVWYAQAMEHWAWSNSGVTVTDESPEFDFHGNPWISRDPLRLVLWISGEPMALTEATSIDWDRVTDLPGGMP